MTDATFPHIAYSIDSRVMAFSTTREAYNTSAPYDGFNITHYCGDQPAHVAACRSRLCAALHVAPKRLVLPRQTHGTAIRLIDDAFFALTDEERAAALDGIDAVMTAATDCCIGVSTADCLPILLYDAAHHCAAAAHAGWRGMVGRIGSRTLRAMTAAFGTRPEDVRAVLGPAITLPSFEVGEEVAEAFAAAGFRLTDIGRRFPARDGERWHIDLHAAATIDLCEAGIDLCHLMVGATDTFTHTDEFFSARRLGIGSGRIFTGIVLRKM